MHQFKQLSNFRDLGGLRTRDQRSIKEKCLLRSGQLYGLPQEEVNLLVNQHNLVRVIDFRTQEEIKEKPNTEMAGVEQLQISVLGETEVNPPSDQSFIQGLESMDADEMMLDIYRGLILDRGSQKGFSEYLHRLLEQEEGAVLWHCFAGKDRTGVAALYLLSALGVEDHVILSDYLETNKLRIDENNKLIEEARLEGVSHKGLENYRVLLGVKEEYLKEAIRLIDEQYGGRERYIREVLGFGEEKQAFLRHKYLD